MYFHCAVLAYGIAVSLCAVSLVLLEAKLWPPLPVLDLPDRCTRGRDGAMKTPDLASLDIYFR